MYVLAIHVPVFKENTKYFITTEWKRSLVLLRDSFRGYFGQFSIVAPYIEIMQGKEEQNLEPVDELEDIFFTPSFPHSCRARHYWLKYRKKWIYDVHKELVKGQIFHGGFADLYRPMNFDALRQAFKLKKPTVFARDTDELLKRKQMIELGAARNTLESYIYFFLYKKAIQYCISKADLSLLKGRTLYNRYSSYSSNCKLFHDTSYLSNEIVPDQLRVDRLKTLQMNRPLRFVYCGRFEERKGLMHSLEILHKVKKDGCNIELDLIGDGMQLGELKKHVASLGLEQNVRFLGRVDYNAEIFRELVKYDALFFTPLAEDTPRMIFDGYAAGLPIIGYDIEYLKERSENEDTAMLSPLGDIDAFANSLKKLDNNREWFYKASDNAYHAAQKYAADVWYGKRAKWTIDMYERKTKR